MRYKLRNGLPVLKNNDVTVNVKFLDTITFNVRSDIVLHSILRTTSTRKVALFIVALKYQ